MLLFLQNLLLKNILGLNLSAITSNIHTEAISANVNFQVIFHTYPEGVLMTLLRAKCRIPVSNGSLVIYIKQKVQETFRTGNHIFI
jgi:hypothetical protein